MTRIDFYQIETNESAEAFCCRLVSKAWRQGHHVYIHTGSEKQARTLDDLLWTFRRESFIPHGLMGQGDVEQPVEIGSKDPGRHTEVMINLTDEIPDFFSRFERIEDIDDTMAAFHGIVSHKSQLGSIAESDPFHHFPLDKTVTLVELRKDIF